MDDRTSLSPSALRHENRVLQSNVRRLEEELRHVEAERQRALKSAEDAWAFARVALKTKRPMKA